MVILGLLQLAMEVGNMSKPPALVMYAPIDTQAVIPKPVRLPSRAPCNQLKHFFLIDFIILNKHLEKPVFYVRPELSLHQDLWTFGSFNQLQYINMQSQHFLKLGRLL